MGPYHSHNDANVCGKYVNMSGRSLCCTYVQIHHSNQITVTVNQRISAGSQLDAGSLIDAGGLDRLYK